MVLFGVLFRVAFGICRLATSPVVLLTLVVGVCRSTINGTNFQDDFLNWCRVMMPYIKWFFQPWINWLDAQAYDCVMDEINEAYWADLYHVPVVGWIAHMFRPYRRVGTNFWCQLLFTYWDKPEVYYPWYVRYFSLIISFGAMVWAIFICISIFYMLRRLMPQVHTITITNGMRGFDIASLKNSFRSDMKQSCKAKHTAGSHEVLAHQRRVCESWCLDVLGDYYTRVRDVGGSRNRHAEFTGKHVCNPIYNNADVFRELKGNNLFESCNLPGECCPLRHEIPAAIISHADYYMSPRQLTQIITGPTFIINHSFDKSDLGEWMDEDGNTHYEAHVEKINGHVTMQPEGGTPYVHHAYNNWLEEGTCVSEFGAFVYVKVGTYLDTQVIYCIPADGVYRMDDINNLQRSVSEECTYVTKTEPAYNVELNAGSYQFTQLTPSGGRMVNSTFAMKKNVVEEIALMMSDMKRDDKYYTTFKSYLLGSVKSYSLEVDDIAAAFDFIRSRSDWLALNVSHASVIVGAPSDLGLLQRFWVKFVLMTTHSWPCFSKLGHWLMVKATKRMPWAFKTIALPTYEVFSKAVRSRLVGQTSKKLLFDRFRVKTSGNLTPAAGLIAKGTGQNSGQCNNKSGNTSTKLNPSPPPVVNVAIASKPSTCVPVPTINRRRSEPIVASYEIARSDTKADAGIDNEEKSEPFVLERCCVNRECDGVGACDNSRSAKTPERSTDAGSRRRSQPTPQETTQTSVNPGNKSHFQYQVDRFSVQPFKSRVCLGAMWFEGSAVFDFTGAKLTFDVPESYRESFEVRLSPKQRSACLSAIAKVVNEPDFKGKQYVVARTITECIAQLADMDHKGRLTAQATHAPVLITTGEPLVRPGYRTITLGGVGFSIPLVEAKTVNRSTGENPRTVANQQRCRGKVFPKNRNQPRQHRPTQHFSKK